MQKLIKVLKQLDQRQKETTIQDQSIEKQNVSMKFFISKSSTTKKLILINYLIIFFTI
jgi:hypothetical protein